MHSGMHTRVCVCGGGSCLKILVPGVMSSCKSISFIYACMHTHTLLALIVEEKKLKIMVPEGTNTYGVKTQEISNKSPVTGTLTRVF